MLHGLLVAALRAERLAYSGRFFAGGAGPLGACSHFSDTLLEEIDPENMPVGGTFVFRPAGMDAGVAAVQRAVVPRQTVRIRIRFCESHRLEWPASLHVVLDEPRALIVSGHHPDAVFDESGPMRPR